MVILRGDGRETSPKRAKRAKGMGEQKGEHPLPENVPAPPTEETLDVNREVDDPRRWRRGLGWFRRDRQGMGGFLSATTLRATVPSMKPERALAIEVYDYFAAISFGVISALSASFLVPGLLPIPLAMLAGMGVGLVAALPLLGLFSYLLGGFEVVVMSMQIGMLAGMVGVMMGQDGVTQVVLAGAMTGLVIQGLLDVANRALRGEVTRHD